MDRNDQDRIEAVTAYHERTKHRFDRYAASAGYLDWASQPDPFRRYTGVGRIELLHPAQRAVPTYDDLFDGSPPVRPLDADSVSRLFYHSLALSAWKRAPGGDPWSLRVNPSSGALHPTEGYLVSGSVAGLIERPGVFHYDPFGHGLETLAEMTGEQWTALTAGLPEACLLVGLTSIHWRESWKYGERAFRYCHHDVGHAIGAVALAARSLGWEARLLDGVADDDLDRLFGCDRQSGIEAEHADGLLALFPAPGGEEDLLPGRGLDVPDLAFVGEPNRLSGGHREWPVIGEVAAASRTVAADIELGEGVPPRRPPLNVGAAPADPPSAEALVRGRRSAVAMDGATPLGRDAFYRMLARTLPADVPFAVLPWAPRVSLAVFVHRVEGLEPGLYVLVRDPSHEESLRSSLKSEFAWDSPPGCPADLPLYRLLEADARHVAKSVSCHQDIAADGAFSLGMLAEFDAALVQRGPSFYPRLFWETGLIGQMLYLEAEAAGVRGTGIGCFFDDAVHEVLGIGDRSWQSLYHFTIGAPVVDSRLETLPAYAHLEQKDT